MPHCSLSFLPMLPTQILLNNLLYDVSEMTIPTDNVDEEQLRRPAHWDTRLIRRFMTFFGPISSIFDFATFGIMIWGFGAGATLFRSGWFVESLATQSLVIFAIRTHRVPFFHSRPSKPLTIATFACVSVGVALPFSREHHPHLRRIRHRASRWSIPGRQRRAPSLAPEERRDVASAPDEAPTQQLTSPKPWHPISSCFTHVRGAFGADTPGGSIRP